MKSTGMVRRVDELGRIVIPKELRKTLNISLKDPIEIFIDAEKIILQKYKAAQECFITGEINHENKQYANGNLTLSSIGATLLLEEIKLKFNIDNDN